MLEETISKSWRFVKRNIIKIILVGGLALSTASALGYQKVKQKPFTPNYSQAELEQRLEQAGPQGPYGIVYEADNDNNPALDFSIRSYIYKDQLVEIKYGKSPLAGAKTYLFWVHRDFDNEKAGIIESIRKEINKKPYRVQVFGDYKLNPFERNGVKYDGTVKPGAVMIYDCTPVVDEASAQRCTRAYILEGVLGMVRGVVDDKTGTVTGSQVVIKQ
jgi:hypothetical protein